MYTGYWINDDKMVNMVPSWLKGSNIVWTDPKWFKIIGTDTNWSKTVWNVQNCSEIVQIGSKRC